MLSHLFFNALAKEPPIDWITGDESRNHPDLHHEPKDGIGLMQFMAEDDEDGDCHPAIHTDLPGRKRQRIRLDRCAQACPGRETVHGGDRIVLKGNAQQKGKDKIDHPGTEDGFAKEREGGYAHNGFGDNISQRAATSAVRGAHPDALPKRLFWPGGSSPRSFARLVLASVDNRPNL